MTVFPYLFEGYVVHGFGRGGKMLGCPTANLCDAAVAQLPDSFDGIYYGLAQVDGGKIYGMVMSVGCNEQFGNKIRSLEVHILHEFENDFYGSILRGMALGYLRPMRKFDALDALIVAIREDIANTKNHLTSVRIDDYEKLPHFSRNIDLPTST